MPRKKTKSLQRTVAPDRVFESEMVQRLINKVMLDGKKQLAEILVYEAMENAAKKVNSDKPLEVLEQAYKNVAPRLEVRSRRVGGANYQIPYEVKGPRQTHLTLMWLVAAAREKKGIPFGKALAQEISDAFNQTGMAVKKREDTHRMAEANRAFAHFAKF